MSKISRRKFIKLAGSSAALSTVHALGNSPTLSAMPDVSSNYLDKFDHVVVLMLENRSFDNLLGFLYGENDVPGGQKFEGVSGKKLSNPIPPDAEDAGRKVVPVTQGHTMDNPNPDPGEEYPHVNTQLFGTVLPEGNRYMGALDMSAPFNLPPGSLNPTMDGFVADYINNYRLWMKRMPKYDEYKVIMECFPPDSVPVLSTLAREFVVFDHWYCSVPSQTFCNRSFFHAASSSGMVINAPYANWVSGNNAETIFNRMEKNKISWKVYFDQEDVFSLTCLIHYPRLKQHFRSNFFLMEHFYEDAASGNLPKYSFIEPRLFVNHNDMHPPFEIRGKTFPSSVMAGEMLVNDVYNAIRLSSSTNGSNFQNTLLLITFDEHGGCYDHVPPPAAVPPDPAGPAGQMGFHFDRQGVRVPAIIVSAYTERGTIVNSPVHHTSLMKTLSEKWNLGSLTARDESSPNLHEALNRTSIRESKDWPVITPRKLPEKMEEAALEDRPLNNLQKDILGLANVIAGAKGESLKEMTTVHQAIKFMRNTIGKDNN